MAEQEPVSVALGGATSRPEAVRGGGSRQLIKNCYSVTSSEEGGGKGGRRKGEGIASCATAEERWVFTKQQQRRKRWKEG